MSDLNPSHFEHAAKKSVKEELRGAGWPVYKDYEVVTEDGDAFVVAPVSHASFFEAEPREVVVQEGVMKGSRQQRFAGRDPAKDAITFYAPLRTPELVLDLAELAERETTPQVVLEWAQVYGLLGFPDEDSVGSDEGFMKLKVNGMGRRDRVQRFTEAAGEIRERASGYSKP